MTCDGVQIQTTRNRPIPIQFNTESCLFQSRCIRSQLDARTARTIQQHPIWQVKLCKIICTRHRNLPRRCERFSFTRMKKGEFIERCIRNRLTCFGLFGWYQNVQSSHLLSDVRPRKDALEWNAGLRKGFDTALFSVENTDDSDHVAGCCLPNSFHCLNR